MIKNAKCIIDLAAVRHNLQTIKKLAAGRKIILMVKSNAYGHGLLEVCQQLDNDVALGLIEFDKALLLRQHNFQQKIILMTGPSDITDIETAAKNNFDLVIHQQYQIDLLRQAKVENKINIWLKVNTGMNRLGFFISDAADAFKQITALDITANTNVISHLSSPDEPTSTACQSQLKKLQQLHELIPEAEFSFCNSAGLINNLYPEANWLRPGIILYGISPVKDKTAADLNLKPVMTVQAPIISIYRVTAGDTIGYGATYLCKKRYDYCLCKNRLWRWLLTLHQIWNISHV